MFACAESGAPVSNMTSAYGGIRWSSGIIRSLEKHGNSESTRCPHAVFQCQLRYQKRNNLFTQPPLGNQPPIPELNFRHHVFRRRVAIYFVI